MSGFSWTPWSLKGMIFKKKCQKIPDCVALVVECARDFIPDLNSVLLFVLVRLHDWVTCQHASEVVLFLSVIHQNVFLILPGFTIHGWPPREIPLWFFLLGLSFGVPLHESLFERVLSHLLNQGAWGLVVDRSVLLRLIHRDLNHSRLGHLLIH